MRVNLSPIQGSYDHIISYHCTQYHGMSCMDALCLQDSLGLVREGTQRTEKS